MTVDVGSRSPRYNPSPLSDHSQKSTTYPRQRHESRVVSNPTDRQQNVNLLSQWMSRSMPGAGPQYNQMVKQQSCRNANSCGYTVVPVRSSRSADAHHEPPHLPGLDRRSWESYLRRRRVAAAAPQSLAGCPQTSNRSEATSPRQNVDYRRGRPSTGCPTTLVGPRTRHDLLKDVPSGQNQLP